MKINKRDFISYMNRLLNYLDREKQLSEAMGNYCEDLWFFHPKDVITLVEDLLVDLTGDNKDDSIISYWLYELDCGKKWEPGTITTLDGIDIKLQTVEDLYKYLVSYNEGRD